MKNFLQLRGIMFASVLAGAAVLALAVLAPWLARATLPVAPGCPAGAPRVRLVVWNVSKENPSPSRAVEFLAGSGADAILLLEAKGLTADVATRLAARYPYLNDCHARVRCSTLILTRNAPVAVRQLGSGDVENRKGLSAVRVEMAGGPSLVALHLSRPWPAGRQATELQALAAQAGPGSAIGGDFNMTPMFPALRRFIETGGLALATPAGGSWPAHIAGVPMLPMLPMLAIDHLLLGKDWGGSARWGPALGSDHRPLIADLCRLEGNP
ncbi:MAG: endonuclease/exonuclease/phosphatase family protein [Sandaracinobacteroides sp.]